MNAMTQELLLEIGTEEIPAAFLPGALTALKTIAEKEFADQRIAASTLVTFGTPRRLVLMAREVAAAQRDLVVTKTGPAKRAAFAPDGTRPRQQSGLQKVKALRLKT